MSDAERSTSSAEQKQPLSNWQRWLEFLQVIAVLLIATGCALPFAIGLDVPGAWIGAAALAVLGVLVADLSLRLIDVDAEIATDERFEITSTRLLTLGSIGTPPDVIDALREMCAAEIKRWDGTAAGFRDEFYARVGERRGATYLPRVLPYLSVYSSRPQQGSDDLGDGIVSNDDMSIPLGGTKFPPLGGPTRL